jgi:hypothetical protein
MDPQIEHDEPEQHASARDRDYGPLELRSLVEGADRPDAIVMARRALEPVQRVLSNAGYYAYGTFDDQHRWSIAVDDEAGRVDVRVGSDGFVVELWASSPGLYADEENEWRRRAMERLARMTIPSISEGQLAANQQAEWDETDHGVAVRIVYELPFNATESMGQFVKTRLPELEELLTYVESRVAS